MNRLTEVVMVRVVSTTTSLSEFSERVRQNQTMRVFDRGRADRDTGQQWTSRT